MVKRTDSHGWRVWWSGIEFPKAVTLHTLIIEIQTSWTSSDRLKEFGGLEI